jgi:multidrug efflux pump subunit AcrA (membrane-fusion protein)
VATAAVGRSTVTEVVDVPASVTAHAVATLTAPADGTLARLLVAPGASVRKGAVVAVIDSPSARKRLADARSALAATNGIGATSSVNLTGVQRSLDASAADAFASARTAATSVTDPQLRAALLAQVDAARKHYAAESAAVTRVLGQVQRGVAGIGQAMAALGAAQRVQARTAYDLARSEVDALTMRAPISGVVQLSGPSSSSGSGDPLSALLSSGAAGALAGGGAAGAGASTRAAPVAGVDDVLAVGDRVSAGAPVLTVVDVSEIGLVGEVDETDVLLVAAGVAADVELDAAPGQRYEATVRTIDLLPTPSARGGVAYRVRLTFTDASGANGGSAPPTPRPGMSAVAHLRVRTAVDAVTVPASAVFTSGGGDAVWVVGDDGRAVSQTVTLGVQGEDLVQVRSGLRPGQRVVVTGADKVSPGDAIS